MSATFLVVPQWQGSGSDRAMRLVDGAEAIRGDLPSSVTVLIDVPLEAGDALGTGIARLSSLRTVRDNLEFGLLTAENRPIVIGGDCGVAWAPVVSLARADAVAVVWFDAHPDLNDADSSPSQAFGGMVLRTLIDDEGIDAGTVVVAGARAFDDEEDRFVERTRIRHVSVYDMDTPDALLEAVAATGASEIYIHIDLDVLDPAEVSGVGEPVPFGLSATGLLDAVRALRERWPLVGASLCGFAPGSPDAAIDDLPVILRLIGALARD
jgi:arginase